MKCVGEGRGGAGKKHIIVTKELEKSEVGKYRISAAVE